MPNTHINLPDFATPALSDIQFLLQQDNVDIQALDSATREALITMLEQEIKRLEPMINTRAVTNTVRQIAMANR